MNTVAGISLSSLAPGSKVIAVLKSKAGPSQSETVEEYTSVITDKDDLQSALEQLAQSFPPQLEDIVLTVPIYFTDAEKILVDSAFKGAGIMIRKRYDHFMSYLLSTVEEEYKPQNELMLDIGSSAAGCRLVCTEVEDEIRVSSDAVAEIKILEEQKDASELVRQLVDPALAELQAKPTDAGADLHRVVVINSCSSLVPQLVKLLRLKLSSSVQIVTEDHPAEHAAMRAMHFRRDRFADKFIFNVSLLRIGVVKADGFVHTLLARWMTLPNNRSACFTNFKDDQTRATVKIVAGVGPRAKDNTVVAELVLDDLAPCPKSEMRILVTLDVEHMGETKIVVEELAPPGEMDLKLKRKAVVLEKETGAMTIEEIEAYWAKSEEGSDEEVEKAEAYWAEKTVQGELPE